LLWLLARKKKKRQLLQQPKQPHQLLTQPHQLLLLLTQPQPHQLLTLLLLQLLTLLLPLRLLLRPLRKPLRLLRKPLRLLLLPSNWPGLPSSDGILKNRPFRAVFLCLPVCAAFSDSPDHFGGQRPASHRSVPGCAVGASQSISTQ
jgi:hypothetical protein